MTLSAVSLVDPLLFLFVSVALGFIFQTDRSTIEEFGITTQNIFAAKNHYWWGFYLSY